MEEEYNDHGGLSLLPESCLSEMISKTSIKDACRSSAVSRGFKSASESDSVWEEFLPSDYQEIISKSHTPLNFATKKQLFFLLCDSPVPVLINNGTLCFRLCKINGKKCFMLRARELSIAWKDSPMYWLWKPFPESRFSEVAELLCVCWLHIHGKMQTKYLSPKTTYAAYIVYKVEDNSYGLETASKSSVKFIGDEDANANANENRVYLMSNTGQVANGRVGEKRTDGWMEIWLGEFYNDEGDGEIEMQLSETNSLNWKKGLILEGIEVRPKED